MPSFNRKRGIVRFSDTGSGSSGSDTDSLFSSVSLLCHFDGADGSTTFTDSSSNSLSLTAVGDAQLDTAQFKYGTASLLLDGTGDRVTLPNNAVLNLQADFTIEFWIRLNTSTSAGTILALGDDGTAGEQAQLVYWNGTQISFYASSGAAANNIANNVTIGTPSNLTWHYVRVSRIDDVYFLSMDGVLRPTFTSSLTPNNGTSHAIGNDPATLSTPLACHLDELRITKGESRIAFTTPTAAFPDSA